ncbi:hypothetical protein [Mangrovihabitans endophyticus]|uniref:Exosortase/archaeosortase family protein n=1 Tax=Mangrovihabitans endophyticus TaxID=1751298 RepID=A0A8J3C1Y2_9ACTN|nr:hypothetical protein [Mangrovihabitans endophyticus]GGL07015.1 hypothetical protein GCM10012284_46490 [Mangrovihabitans endophyticus]
MTAVVAWTRGVGPARIVAAALMAGIVLAGLVFDDAVRHSEACLSAATVRASGLADAVCLTDAVTYHVDGRLAGHAVTYGCSAVLLMPPVAAVCSFLALVRRIPLIRPVAAFLVATTMLVLANQARMLAIVLGMRNFGVETGYALTHVLIGTAVSVFGVLASGYLAIQILITGRGADAPRSALSMRPAR